MFHLQYVDMPSNYSSFSPAQGEDKDHKPHHFCWKFCLEYLTEVNTPPESGKELNLTSKFNFY